MTGEKSRKTAKSAFVFSIIVMAVCAEGPPRPVHTAIVRFSSKRADAPRDGNISTIDAQHIWVGLLYTENGGSSWVERVPSATAAEEFIDFPSNAQSIQPTFFVSSKRGWLSGYDSVWSTMDGGITWSKLVEGGIYVLAFAHKRIGWMGVGDDRTVRNYVTRDFGHTWRKCGGEWQTRIVAPFRSVSLLQDGTGWVIVAKYDQIRRPLDYGVAKTEDGGCTWKVIWWKSDRDPDILGTMHFIDKKDGWLFAAGYGKLRRSSDGGLTWRDAPLPVASFEIRGGWFVDRSHGWISGAYAGMRRADSGIFYTSDGGEHWIPVSKSDLRANRGLAREIPPSWNEGVFVKALTAHAKLKEVAE